MSLKTLQDKFVSTESDSENYINVDTGRKITNLKKKGYVYKTINYKNNIYFLCGETHKFEEFLENNNIDENGNPVAILHAKSPPKAPNTTIFSKITSLFKKEEEDEPVCDPKTVGSTLFIPNSENVEDIPSHVVDRMCPFELSGIEGKAKVVRLKDADTLELLIYVKITEMSREKSKGRSREKKVSLITNHHQAGFFSIFVCRMDGIDAAEHNTAQGQLATLLLENYFESLNNIVYIKVKGFDKYGRMLADVYSDRTMENLINGKLINLNVTEMSEIIKTGIRDKKIDKKSDKNKKLIYDDENQYILALPYFGETKDSRLKNYYDVPKNFIRRGEHDDLLIKYRII